MPIFHNHTEGLGAHIFQKVLIVYLVANLAADITDTNIIIFLIMLNFNHTSSGNFQHHYSQPHKYCIENVKF